MSSMFKKKGGLAFKPKIPSTRPRPGPKQAERPAPSDTIQDPASPIPTSQENLESEASVEPSTQTTQVEASQVPEVQTRSRRRSSAASSTKGIERSTRQAIQNATKSAGADTTGGRAATPAATQETLEPVVEESQDSQEPARRLTRRGRRASRLETPTSTAVTEPASSIAPLPTPESTEPTTGRVTRGRRRASIAATDAAAETATARPTKRARRTQVAEASATDGATETAPQPARRRRKSSAPTATTEDGSRPRRARSATPEDSENQVVDLQRLKMSDLTKDLHIGKKFSRHDELRDRERRQRAQSRIAKEEILTDSRSGTPVNGNASDPPPPPPPPPAASAAPSGPQFRIVDGQIVLDQSSLVMDRHARAAAAQVGQDMETIEENDFTRLITSSSYMNSSKLRGPNVWTEAETEQFYRGLSMMGTDFEMIAQMIPGKQRRHVKLKFNREERHNPQRINAALIGEKTIKIDIDEYQAASGAAFEPVEDIEAEQRKVEESYEAERQRVADEQAEIMRKKREELFADDEVPVKKKKGGKRKEKIQYGLNGEPINGD